MVKYIQIIYTDILERYVGLLSEFKTFQKHAVLLDHLGRGALSETTEKQAEEFTCTNNAAINEVCYRLFQRDTKDREKLPPTQRYLSKHIQCAHYTSRVWYLADSTSLATLHPIQ